MKWLYYLHSTSNGWKFLLLHILANMWCCLLSGQKWILAILIGVQLYFIVVLICISLIKYDVKYLFICILVIYISFWWDAFLGLFPFLKSGCSYWWVLRTFWIFWITVFYQMCHMKAFSSNLWLFFSFSWHCLLYIEHKF